MTPQNTKYPAVSEREKQKPKTEQENNKTTPKKELKTNRTQSLETKTLKQPENTLQSRLPQPLPQLTPGEERFAQHSMHLERFGKDSWKRCLIAAGKIGWQQKQFRSVSKEKPTTQPAKPTQAKKNKEKPTNQPARMCVRVLFLNKNRYCKQEVLGGVRERSQEQRWICTPLLGRFCFEHIAIKTHETNQETWTKRSNTQLKTRFFQFLLWRSSFKRQELLDALQSFEVFGGGVLECFEVVHGHEGLVRPWRSLRRRWLWTVLNGSWRTQGFEVVGGF